MYVLFFILSIWIFIKTLSYAIYEIKQEKNRLGGTIALLLALTALIFPIIMVLIRGIY
ncbi:MAG: hypothetical protein IJN50_00345 [Clostridia bacterium]|nr:hypothetical protein [Clostridia bacterium]